MGREDAPRVPAGCRREKAAAIATRGAEAYDWDIAAKLADSSGVGQQAGWVKSFAQVDVYQTSDADLQRS